MTTDARSGGPVARLVRAAFHQPLLVAIAVLVGAALGLEGLGGLNRDVFPDLSTPVFSLIVQSPAMGAEDLELAVAVPMELALAGLPDVRRVRSTSAQGVVSVVVEFEPDADVLRARQLLAERVATVTLPPGAEAPLISSLSGRLNEIFEFTLEAEPGAADLMTLRDLAEFEVRSRLMAVPGVAEVERLGGALREVQVRLDPARMGARGVSLDEVLHAARGASLNAAGGLLTEGSVEWTVRVSGQAASTEDLRATVVAVRGGTPVRLGEVAEVVEGPALRRGIAHRLDGEVVSCRVSKQFGADTVTVAAGLRRALAEIEATLPPGVRARVVYDQSALVDEALTGVARAVGLGALFVVVVLFLFLGDWRAAALVTLTLPLSVALSGLLLERAGVGLNTMTLGGLAIAVGLLVDASIIVTENMLHRLRHRGDRAAALAAAAEVGRPIAYATLIVVLVFSPLFAMEGLEGKTWRPLAAAVIACMSASLLLALTATPLAAAALLVPRGPSGGGAPLAWLRRLHAPALDAALRRPGRVVLASVALTVPGLFVGAGLGRDLMPALDEGAFLVQTFVPAEASLDEVDGLNHRVEDALRRVPEVVEVSRRTGRSERTGDPMPHTVSDVLVLLSPERRRPLRAIEAELRERLEGVPGVASAVTTPLGMRIDEGLGGSPADVSIRVFASALDDLERLGEAVRARVEGVEGLTDLRVEPIAALPRVNVEVDREAAARAGLTPGEVVEAVRVGLVGEVVGELRVGSRRHDLVVRLAEEHRRDAEALRGLLVDGHDGTRVPLGQLARVEQGLGPATLRREAGSRRVAVEGSVVGRDLAGVARDIEARLADLALPPGGFIQVGGRVEGQARAERAMIAAVGVAVAGVFVLLLLALGSAAEALTLVLTLPVALVGGVLALRLSGGTWNVSSMVGLIGLLGIAVQNGLVLVTQARGLRAEGASPLEALREASLGRVRPKLMTAGTAALGLLPVLLLDLRGTEIERPLAVVMVGGLLSSTLYTLVALPAVLHLVQGISISNTESDI